MSSVRVAPFFYRNGEYQTSLARFSAIVPRITGTMSFIGSALIIYVLISDRKKMLSKVKYRIIFSMSCIDCLSSLAVIPSSILLPKGTPGVWDARGNTATCDVQGFFYHLGYAVGFYNCALSLYYLLVVRYKVKDDVISKRYEPLLHGFSVLYPLITGIVSVKLGLFNAYGSFCWFQAHPYLCNYTDKYECTRGSDAVTYKWIFGGIPVFSTLVFIPLFMSMLVYTVFKTEQRMLRYSNTFENKSKLLQTRQTRNQALLYVGAYVMTFMWGIPVNIMMDLKRIPPTSLILLALGFMPLQGFWNFFIFMFPRYALVGKAYPTKSVWKKCYETMKVLDVKELQKLARRNSAAQRKSSQSNSAAQRKSSQSNLPTLKAST